LLSKGLLSSFFFLIAVALHSAPVYGGSFGFWPLFSYTQEGQHELEVIGPLFTWKENKEGSEWGLRPFLYRTDDPAQGLRRWEFLYPFAKYQIKEGDTKAYIVPFSLFRDEVTSSSPERRERASSILTAFWGETDHGERYGGFFPIAGRFKERFSRDEIEFYLWPFYSRIEDDKEITWRTPWPFFSHFGGEARGLYIWPFWGHRERAGVYDRGFILWPFYDYMDQNLDTDNPVRKRFYLPFYASVRSRGARADIYCVLFLHQRADNPPLEIWDFPWPFVTLVRGEKVRETQIFPLFRVRDEEQKRRFYILWPFYKYEWDRITSEEGTAWYFLLIDKYRITKELDTGNEALDANFWPVFDYRRGFAGEKSLYIFPLLPFHDDGMQRNIYPLFWVYRYTRSPQGEIFSDLLWGLYRRRVSAEFSSTQFAFFLRIEKRGATDVSLSFLEGLIRYQGRQEGAKVGLFFIGP
jgi:hypothetical protein